jgi:YVTN family beta-propeller protein
MKALFLAVLAAMTLACSPLVAQTIIDTVPVGQMPVGVAVNSKNNRIFVANGQDLSVSVIDGASDQLLGTMITDNRPTDIAVNAVKNEIWVSESDGGGNMFAEVFDGNSFSLIKSIPLGSGIGRIAVHPHLNRVYVSNEFSSYLAVIDGSRKVVLTNVNLPCAPFGVTVNTATQRVYVGTQGCAAGSVYVMEPTRTRY